MVFWASTQPVQAPPLATNAGMDHGEESLAEVDEEPDDRKSSAIWTPGKLDLRHVRPAPLQNYARRESLLTRQLHSETDHSDEDHAPPRALSTQSTWSNSTAELTSDDGRSMASPAISPPLPPTHVYNALPIHEKPLDKKLQVVGEEAVVTSGPEKETGSEKTVEATLGRKRCIMFACRGKDEAKPKTPPPTSTPAPAAPEQPAAASPPPRKCMIKFACPTRSGSDTKPAEAAPAKRPISPPPMTRKTSAGSKAELGKQHRGSDSTVTHASPRSVRKSPSGHTTSPPPATKPVAARKLSADSDDTGTEAMRFHEFASSEDEQEEWVKESTCHRKRLTINDTLFKENEIRNICGAAEEEVIEEEEEDEDEIDETDAVDALDDEDEDEDEDEDDGEDEDAESEQSDDGFHSDDEEGFAASDDEGEDSDYEWWKPGGSTAATSIDHLDRLHIMAKPDDEPLASSLNSAASSQVSPYSKHGSHRRRRKVSPRNTASIPIANRFDDDDLPDSTDFICGTLDEDRPLEQAYIERVKQMEAAKHKARPQDIDPTFPTSDPEMDEEDDEDLEDPEESEDENMMHGDMDELDGSTLRRPRTKSRTARSPPPPNRRRSPAPLKRTSKQLSPAPLLRRGTARSPPPARKLFGNTSPKRVKSPAPVNRMTSPPNTRRTSPTGTMIFNHMSRGLADRPELTHTASFPRNGFALRALDTKRLNEDVEYDVTNEIPKRGAIDIYKGLQKKNQRRQAKLYQQRCAKNERKGDKAYKVKPGRGCERMREVGLHLQQYHGKTQHILSV